MRYRCNILHRLIFVAFIEIVRIKLLYKVVGCAKQIMCLPNSKRISVPMHESSHRPWTHFTNTWLDVLFSNCLNSVTPLQSMFPLKRTTAQMRSTIRLFAQLTLILACLQHSKFNIVFESHRPFTVLNASLVVRLHVCAVACALKEIFA